MHSFLHLCVVVPPQRHCYMYFVYSVTYKFRSHSSTHPISIRKHHRLVHIQPRSGRPVVPRHVAVALQRCVRSLGAVLVLVRDVHRLVSVRPKILQRQTGRSERQRAGDQLELSVRHQNVPKMQPILVLCGRKAALPVGRLTGNGP